MNNNQGAYNDQGYETEGFEDQGFDDGAYQDGYDDGYAGDTAEEDFPEPGQPGAPKKKPGPLAMAAGGALAVCLVVGAGYYFMAPPAEEGGEAAAEGGGFAFEMPDIMGMIGMGGGDEAPTEEPPAEEGAGEEAPPPKPKAAKPAAKAPARPAAKPNDGWKKPQQAVGKPNLPATKSKPAAPKPAVAAKPPAPKPKPIAAAPAKPAGGAKPSAQTAVAFAAGSYWVPAAEMERLWSFSSGLKTDTGRITIEAHPGNEPDAQELARKRGARIAELIKTNVVGNRYTVDVKIGPKAAGGKVNVYYSRAL